MLPLISRAPCLNCPWIVSARTISTSARLDVAGRPDYSAKRNPINFRDFPLANRVGQYDIKHTPDNLLLKHYNYPLCEDTFGQKYAGYWIRDRYVPINKGGRRVGRLRFYYVKEMEPEIIVPPDLESCDHLKPYVSYRSEVVDVPEFTAKALFDNIYRKEIQTVLADENLSSDERAEKMRKYLEVDEEDVHEKRIKARQTGSDLFVQRGWYGIGRERDNNWD